MAKVTFIIVLSLLVFKTGWVKLGELKETVFDPEQTLILDKDRILINDHALKEFPIRNISFSSDSLISELRHGRGPGEVSSIFYKAFTKFTNGDILLWDAGLNRVTVFNTNLEYKYDVTGKALQKRVYQAALINDSTLVTIEYEDFFLKAWRFNDKRIEESDLLWKHSLKEIPELESLRNPIMLQTLYFTNYDNELYIAFEYSSLLMGINEEGIKFLKDGPDAIPIPNPRIDGQFSLPIMGEHPEGARDITADDKHVYVVFSGKNVSKFEQMRYSFKFEDLIDKIKHSKRLWIFDRNNGSFIREEKLPLAARTFQIYQDEAYILNTIENHPKIIKYQLPKDL